MTVKNQPEENIKFYYNGNVSQSSAVAFERVYTTLYVSECII